MANSLKSIRTRNYSNFRGVDFTGGIVSNYRLSDALNVWRDYKDDDCIQTRPGMTLLGKFEDPIYGLFFYKVNNTIITLVHSGTKLYKWNNYPEAPSEVSDITQLKTGLNPVKSRGFVFDQVFFFMDGINYLEYNGTTIKDVEGTIPVTSYWKNPDGSVDMDITTDKDYVNQHVNCLTGKRINTFIADGISTNYQLDINDLDQSVPVTADVDGTTYTEGTGITVDRTNGIVTFSIAPAVDSKVAITFSKTGTGYYNRIANCRICVEFDNRIFFSGNPDYPNAVFHCELNDPRYVRDTAYYELGIDVAPVKALVPGNGVLWVFKEMNQNSSSVYYMTPTIDMSYGDDHKIYPSNNGNISLGCVSTGINFNDDIVFFSNLGLEGVSSSAMYSEKILQHRSSMVDTKMLNESGYNDVQVVEWEGYLLCLLNSHIYLADKRARFQENLDIGYEWFYWELPPEEVTENEQTTEYPVNYITEYRGDLFLANANGSIYKLEGTTDNGEDIHSFLTTKRDDFDMPSYTKTTSKKGCTIQLKKMNNDEIDITSILDGVEKKTKAVIDEKGYAVYKVKNKKFKEIQFKISSDEPFGVYSFTIQGFIAGYVKR